jgi:dimethylargininase
MPGRPLALLRSVPDSFAAALVGGEPGLRLDPERARRQHTAYAEALAAGGFSVQVLPGDERHPDCPFIEDAAVVIGRRALATRPGHPSRRGEVGPVAAALAGLVEVSAVPDDARIDGGDVLQAGRTVFVGRSERTDDAGITALAGFAEPLGRSVVPVPVSGGLHLKSAVTALDDTTLLAAPGMADLPAFGGFDVVVAPGEDPEAANVVRLPDGSILVAAHHPDTAALVAGRGFAVVTVDVSEFAAADGGLTCLSIRLRSVLAAAAT